MNTNKEAKLPNNAYKQIIHQTENKPNDDQPIQTETTNNNIAQLHNQVLVNKINNNKKLKLQLGAHRAPPVELTGKSVILLE